MAGHWARVRNFWAFESSSSSGLGTLDAEFSNRKTGRLEKRNQLGLARPSQLIDSPDQLVIPRLLANRDDEIDRVVLPKSKAVLQDDFAVRVEKRPARKPVNVAGTETPNR